MTKLYGASDDLIEVEGDINAEHGHYDPRKLSFLCSDDTRGTIQYDGNWHIIVETAGSLFKKLVVGNPAEQPHDDEDAKGCSAYSDVLVLNDGIEWVKISQKKYKK